MSYRNTNWNLRAVVNYAADNQLSNIASEYNLIGPIGMAVKKKYID
jgi:hypothetical protein